MIGSNLLSGVRSAFRTNEPHAQAVRNLAQQSLRELPAAELYAVLRALYQNNGLYDTLANLAHFRGVWAPALKALRNPTNRSVEFFASKVLAGPLEIQADNEAIIPAIEQVWKWSNFSSLSTVLARTDAMLGDVFVKVCQRQDGSRVYYQMIPPEYAVDFDEDERGNLTWIRVEQPMSERGVDGKAEDSVHIEVWSKADGTYRRWKITDPRSRLNPVDQVDDLARLGVPTEEITFEAMGIAWVPFVHAKFRDIGEPRGQAAVMPAYDKINEANLQATRLHQMLFRYNNVTQAIQSAGRDPAGRSVPSPVLAGATSTDDGTVTLGDDSLMRLPAGWELVQLVPNLDYAAALAILNDQMAEIEKDLPELAYARLREMGTLSGYAVRLLLGDAIDRALEARANLESVLVRANQMALTIGANARLFPDLGGTYESGAFEHTFAPRDIVALSEVETQQAELTRAQGFQAWVSAGLPAGEALLRVGYTEDQATELVARQAAALGGDEGDGEQ